MLKTITSILVNVGKSIRLDIDDNDIIVTGENRDGRKIENSSKTKII